MRRNEEEARVWRINRHLRRLPPSSREYADPAELDRDPVGVPTAICLLAIAIGLAGIYLAMTQAGNLAAMLSGGPSPVSP